MNWNKNGMPAKAMFWGKMQTAVDEANLELDVISRLDTDKSSFMLPLSSSFIHPIPALWNKS